MSQNTSGGRISRAVKHLNDRTHAEFFLSSLKCRPLESATGDTCPPLHPFPPPLWPLRGIQGHWFLKCRKNDEMQLSNDSDARHVGLQLLNVLSLLGLLGVGGREVTCPVQSPKSTAITRPQAVLQNCSMSFRLRRHIYYVRSNRFISILYCIIIGCSGRGLAYWRRSSVCRRVEAQAFTCCYPGSSYVVSRDSMPTHVPLWIGWSTKEH